MQVNFTFVNSGEVNEVQCHGEGLFGKGFKRRGDRPIKQGKVGGFAAAVGQHSEGARKVDHDHRADPDAMMGVELQRKAAVVDPMDEVHQRQMSDGALGGPRRFERSPSGVAVEMAHAVFVVPVERHDVSAIGGGGVEILHPGATGMGRQIIRP